MLGEPHDILYYLNEGDEIVTVNSAWNRFARENGAPEALGPRVLWRPVWAFISDGTTSLIYRHLIKAAREGRIIDFCIRCDGPSVVRLARMRMHQLRSGLVEVRVRTIEKMARRFIPIEPVARSLAGDAQWCGWCQRIEIMPGCWLPAEAAQRDAGDGVWERPLHVRHGSCPQCIGRMIAIAKGDRRQSSAVPAELWPSRPGFAFGPVGQLQSGPVAGRS